MKAIFKALLISVPVALLLLLSYNGSKSHLFSVGQDIGVRGISTFKKYFPTWANGSNSKCFNPHAWSEDLPTIYVITPTYRRLMQKAELTRISNTLLHVGNLHWIVVEDSETKTSLIGRLLNNSGLNFTHLNSNVPEKLPSKGSGPRNLALKWLRDRFSVNDSHEAVVYFADDDNTYTLELFEEMRYTKNVSVWPVGFAGGMRYEGCKVNALGKVYGWVAKFAPHRPFAIDMAGFAVNLKLLLSKSNVYFRLTGIPCGHQESTFLSELVTLNEVEPRAANCTKVLVWHTRAQTPRIQFKYGYPEIEI